MAGLPDSNVGCVKAYKLKLPTQVTRSQIFDAWVLHIKLYLIKIKALAWKLEWIKTKM